METEIQISELLEYLKDKDGVLILKGTLICPEDGNRIISSTEKQM
jgi:hypothetical protein